jgi:predicted DNA-binding transcriptional regulator AlpA
MPDREHHSIPSTEDNDRVMSLPEFARDCGLSLATVRRRIADGTGPRIVRLSPRRVGVRVRDRRHWLDARTVGGGDV